MMNRNTLLTSLALLCALAVPGYCSTSFSFTSSAPTSTTFTANGSTLDSMSGVNFNVLTVTDSPLDATGTITYAITNENFQLSGGYLILTGNVGNYTTCTGICSAADNLSLTGAILYEVKIGDTTTTILPGNIDASVIVNTAATSITDAALATAVGITGPTVTKDVATSGVNGDDGTLVSGSTYSFTAYSESLNTTVSAAPEPVSLLMAGGGLLMVGGLARKRRRTTNV